MAPITNPGQGRAQTLLAFNVVFLILPYPFILARLWARRLTQLALSWNDYLLVIALVGATMDDFNNLGTDISRFSRPASTVTRLSVSLKLSTLYSNFSMISRVS